MCWSVRGSGWVVIKKGISIMSRRFSGPNWRRINADWISVAVLDFVVYAACFLAGWYVLDWVAWLLKHWGQ